MERTQWTGDDDDRREPPFHALGTRCEQERNQQQRMECGVSEQDDRAQRRHVDDADVMPAARGHSHAVVEYAEPQQDIEHDETGHERSRPSCLRAAPFDRQHSDYQARS